MDNVDDLGFLNKWGTPIAVWFIRGNPIYKWMIWGYPNLRNPQIFHHSSRWYIEKLGNSSWDYFMGLLI